MICKYYFFDFLAILYAGFGLVKETLNPLLGEAPDPEMVNEICEKYYLIH